MSAGRVLLVDDEPTVRDVVAKFLERDGFEVAQLGDGALFDQRITDFAPDLVVLDIMLPGSSGIDLLRRLGGSVPVIMLTARSDEADRVLGLELGADDYVVKPFSPRELVARVRSVLRRATPSSPTERLLQFDGLRIDLLTRECFLDEHLVSLPAKEFDLLAFLAQHPREVHSRATLLERVWASSAEYQDPATVTVHVRRIRQKIELDMERPRWISTVWGVGYRFTP